AGVLASRGAWGAHTRRLGSRGGEGRGVRAPADLEGLDGLVIPGGESTTITKGMERDGLDEAIRSFHRAGGPILGSCAGMIACDRHHLGLGHLLCRPNPLRPQPPSLAEDPRAER